MKRKLSKRAITFLKEAKFMQEQYDEGYRFCVARGYTTTGKGAYGQGLLRSALTLVENGLAVLDREAKYREPKGCGTDHWTEYIFTLTKEGIAYVESLP